MEYFFAELGVRRPNLLDAVSVADRQLNIPEYARVCWSADEDDIDCGDVDVAAITPMTIMAEEQVELIRRQHGRRTLAVASRGWGGGDAVKARFN